MNAHSTPGPLAPFFIAAAMTYFIALAIFGHLAEAVAAARAVKMGVGRRRK